MQSVCDDDVHLGGLCARVIAAFEAGDREACDEAFRQLERQLDGAPVFADRTMRARLIELGVGVDRHLTRCTAVKALIADLALHARREGALLFRWAEDTAVTAPPPLP